MEASCGESGVLSREHAFDDAGEDGVGLGLALSQLAGERTQALPHVVEGRGQGGHLGAVGRRHRGGEVAGADAQRGSAHGREGSGEPPPEQSSGGHREEAQRQEIGRGGGGHRRRAP
jgi:hypothetical protein